MIKFVLIENIIHIIYWKYLNRNFIIFQRPVFFEITRYAAFDHFEKVAIFAGMYKFLKINGNLLNEKNIKGLLKVKKNTWCMSSTKSCSFSHKVFTTSKDVFILSEYESSTLSASFPIPSILFLQSENLTWIYNYLSRYVWK